MTTNLFVVANVKQFRTGGSFRILLPFFRISWGVGVLNLAVFLTVFTIGSSLARFWKAFGISGWGGFKPPHPRYATAVVSDCRSEVGCCEYSHESTSSIKSMEWLEQLSSLTALSLASRTVLLELVQEAVKNLEENCRKELHDRINKD